MTRARDLANLIGSGNFTTETLTATEGQTAFTPSNTFTSNFLQVFYNGLLLDPNVDYTENGTTITLTVPATAGDEMEVVTYNTFSVGDAITQTEADNRYYTQTSADSRFVNAAGDTMTGGLIVSAADTNDIIKLSRTGTSAGSGYIYSNQNETFGVHNGAGAYQLMVDASGRVTMPYQPSFSAWKGSTQNGVTGATVYYGLVCDSVASNIGNHYNSSTGRFTAPVSGTYHFSAHTLFTTSANGRSTEFWISVNNDAQRWFSHRKLFPATTIDVNTVSGSATIYLNAGDYVQPRGFVLGGAQDVGIQGSVSSANAVTNFSGYLIG